VFHRKGGGMSEGGWNVLIPRNPLLRITVAPDPNSDLAVGAFFALGCFEAGDDLYTMICQPFGSC
jgi:hypothetical protein